MAIIAYTGLPGSGKSYGVVANVLLPALQKGRRVWTNIPIKIETLDPELSSRLVLFVLDDITKNPDYFKDVFSSGATIIIDESWRLWPAGLKANAMLEGHKSFLAEHRHMVGEDGFSTEVVLIVQDLQNIAAYPRSLVDKTYRAVKLSAIGADKRYRLDIYEGSITGNSPPAKKRLRQIFGKYEKHIYQHYNSQTMSEAQEHGDEGTTDRRANIFTSPVFRIFIPLGAVACLLVMYYGFGQLQKMYGPHSEEETVVSTVPGTALVAAPIVSPPAQEYPHFYKGKNVYIAFNMGRSPYVEYKIAVQDGDNVAVFDAIQLGKMGYRVIGYDQCYLRLEGHGNSRQVYCQTEEQQTGQGSLVSF